MTRATIIWFVGAAVAGALAGGLHLLRSQIGGAHTGLPLAVGAFGLTVLAAAMLFRGVMVAAGEQDALAGPDPEAEDDEVDDPDALEGADQPDRPEAQPAPAEPAESHVRGSELEHADADADEGEHEAVPTPAPEWNDTEPPAGDTAYDPTSSDDGPAVYTFRRGKPVRDQGERTGRPPRRDRPA